MRDVSEQIVLGRISGLYGVKGWLKILSYTRPHENILTYSPWLVRGKEGCQEMPVLEGKSHGKGLIAVLEGVSDRDMARSLIGADITIKRSQLKDPGPGEYYWHDLLGTEVINQDGSTLGKVTELMETGANDVLVVEGIDRYLIPLVRPEYVTEIDLDNNIIRVAWEL